MLYTQGDFFASAFVPIAIYMPIYMPMLLLATCVLPVSDTIYSAASFVLDHILLTHARYFPAVTRGNGHLCVVTLGNTLCLIGPQSSAICSMPGGGGLGLAQIQFNDTVCCRNR